MDVIEPPFTEEIMETSLPPIPLPQTGLYNGQGDLANCWTKINFFLKKTF